MSAAGHGWFSEFAPAARRWKRVTTPTVLTYDNLLTRPVAASAAHNTCSIADRVRSSIVCASYEPTGLTGVQEKRFVLQFFDMVCEIWIYHGFGLLGVMTSYFGCLVLGVVDVQLVDDSFFKATGLLLAVLLSLRAKNAVSRRQRLQSCVIRMINCSRNMQELAADHDKSHDRGHRLKLRLVLHFIFCDIAAWISGQAGDGDSVSSSAVWDELDGPKLEDMPLEFRASIFRLRGKDSLCVSPRPLLMYLREVCDTLFDPRAFDPVRTDEVSFTRRWHRNIDAELENLVRSFDEVLIYNEEAYTRQFRWLVAALIFIYISLYPWVVRHESASVLGVTTVGMAFVFYGLNSMTQQLEDPFNDHGSGFNLALTFRKIFADLKAEEAVRERCRLFLERAVQSGCDLSDSLHDEFVSSELERVPSPVAVSRAGRN